MILSLETITQPRFCPFNHAIAVAPLAAFRNNAILAAFLDADADVGATNLDDTIADAISIAIAEAVKP